MFFCTILLLAFIGNSHMYSTFNTNFAKNTETPFARLYNSSKFREKYIPEEDYLNITDISFKEYLEKFSMKKHADRLAKMNQTRRMSSEEWLKEFVKSVDPTDDLLKLKVSPGDPAMVNKDARRQIKHNYKVLSYWESMYDRWNLKPRFLELMKQAIYEVRNRMIVMQVYRNLFRDTGLYRMGFLTSRIDSRIKTYSKFAWLSFRMCMVSRQEAEMVHFRPMDVLPTIQKQLEMRYDILLLIELLRENEYEARIVMAKYYQGRRDKFKFADDIEAEQI